VVVFPFLLHITTQQPFRLLLSRQLLYDRELSRASFALCLNALLMLLQPASEESVSEVRSLRRLSSSGSYPVDLSALGDPTGSNGTTGLAVEGAGTHKPFHHGKVVLPFSPSATNSFFLWPSGLTGRNKQTNQPTNQLTNQSTDRPTDRTTNHQPTS
jgi:hypothetical protein